MDKIDLHKALCEEIHNLYVAKNKAYSDSFSETYKIFLNNIACIEYEIINNNTNV